MRDSVKRWTPVILSAGVITYFSSLPGPALPKIVTLCWDKLGHASESALFAFLLARALGPRRWSWAIPIGALFGVLDEVHQSFTPHRNGNDCGDMLADLTGVMLGALALRAFHRWRTPAPGRKSSSRRLATLLMTSASVSSTRCGLFVGPGSSSP